MNLTLSHHAEARMQQRGLRPGDVDSAMRCATEVRPGVFRVRGRDAEGEIGRLKKQIQRLEKLRDKEFVLADGVLVTCYHRDRPEHGHAKSWIRRSRK